MKFVDNIKLKKNVVYFPNHIFLNVLSLNCFNLQPSIQNTSKLFLTLDDPFSHFFDKYTSRYS